MPLFGSSKPTTTVSTYARWFHTFNHGASVPGVDMIKMWVAGMREAVAKEDPRFAAVDMDAFTREWVVLRAEVFGLAWGHAFTGKDDHLIGEGVVAKEILGAQGLWEAGDKYSTAAAKSIERTWPAGERAQNAVMMFQTSFRVQVATSWVKKRAVPGDVGGRVINRFFTQDAWKAGWTMRYLIAEFMTAVGLLDANTGDFRLNDAAMTALQYIFVDIYQGSMETIKQNNIKAG